MRKLIKNMLPYVAGLLIGLVLSFPYLTMVKENHHHTTRKLTSISPNLIEIVCHYEYCPINKTKCKNLKTYFSIDLISKEVTGGTNNSYGVFVPKDTTAEVAPDQIHIKQYWYVAEAPNRPFLMNQFFINRFTGVLYGGHYKFDEKSTNGSVKTVKTEKSNGRCRPIENRLF